MFFGVVHRVALGVVLALATSTLAWPATLPAGFTEAVVASDLQFPTTMQFAPDGRLFVLEQAGRVRVIENGGLLPTPFLTLTVDGTGERGLLGITFDPDFATNQWVYLYYTVPAPDLHNRVIRVTAAGNVAAPGSAVTILDLDPLGTSLYHNGGAMAFGADGKLYIGVGENVMPQLAQDMTTRHGKLLRINADGTIPADNPFYTTATGDNRAIWALGLRNPYNVTFHPAGTSPALLINDVGEQSWEEVNVGVAGANYGWPAAEGPPATPPGNPAFTYPLYSYFHSDGCAIVGGAFYAPATPTFPADYAGAYFFADYCSGWIRRIDPTAVSPVAQAFASGVSSPVDLRVGPDGALYYLARGTSAVYRVQYGNAAPGIISHPAAQTVSAGQLATFTVTASGTGLEYHWQRDQIDIPGAISASYALTAQPADDGARFRVRVSNGAGNVISNEAVLTVSANQAPVATITQPQPGTTYGGGQTITFAATATDAEDGPLAGAAFTWQVDFHHDTHIHPFLPPAGGASGGTFVVPVTGHTDTAVWYRIHLVVRDSQGATHAVYRDVTPRVVQLTVTSTPAGRPLLVDAQPVTAPHTFSSVEGIVRTIGAQTHAAAGVTYTFTGWTDGGPASHEIATPAVATTYTAHFVPSGQVAPTSFTLAANGATLTAAWDRVAGATSYRLEVGSAAGLANLLNLDVGNIAFIQDVVPPGTYFARVRAVHPGGASEPSQEGAAAVTTSAVCVTPPPAPTGYVARTGGLTAALSWVASPAAARYLLEVGSASGLSDLLITDLGNVTAFTATAPPARYSTRLRAVNACGASPPSLEVPIELACAPDAVVPAGLSVATEGGVATFTWQAALGATGYRLQAGSAPGATNRLDAPVGAVTSLAVSLAGVPAGTYHVRVVAESACGIGAPSNEVTLVVP